MKRKPEDPLETALAQIEKLIDSSYETREAFAYGTACISKSSLNRLLAEREDCKVSTLKAIAKGLGRKLVIKLEKPE